MSNTTQKQRVLNRLLAGPKRQSDIKEPESRSVLDQLLYAVCREGTSRQKADQAFRALQTTFFDWNEIRVSSVREVQEALGEIPDAEMRALRIISLLQEIFETTFSFDLEGLHKKGLKQAQKQLERYQGTDPYIVAYTLQMGLGGHALPLDRDMLRTLQRLDVLEGEADEAGRTSLEHLIPKPRGPLFCETLSALAQEYCSDDTPTCGHCPMNDVCLTGQRNIQKQQKRHATERTDRSERVERAGARSRSR